MSRKSDSSRADVEPERQAPVELYGLSTERGVRTRIVVDLVMCVLAFASIALIAWVELEGITHRDPRFELVALIDLGLVGVFLADFIIGLVRAGDRRAYLRSHWFEIPGLVPLYAESASWFRLAQLLRLTRALRLLRALTALRRLRRSVVFLDYLLNRSRLAYSLLVAAGVVLGLASVVWMLERDTNPALAEFGDALWWAVVTTTTVGYGDITPETSLGRVFAGVLMILGIGVIGAVTASLSAALLTADSETAKANPSSRPRLIDELVQLSELHERGALTEAEFALAKRKILHSEE